VTLQSKIALQFLVMTPCFAAMLLLPAGSLHYWPGWAYLTIFVACSFAITIYLYAHDRRLLESRMKNKESDPSQKLFRVFWIPLWICLLEVPGLDYRFGWSERLAGGVPKWLTVFALAANLYAFLVIFDVLRVNRFASSVIQIESEHAVISTGPYGVVRHPMYSALLIMTVATPLALASYLALPVAALIIPVLVFRLENEERVLRQQLRGYGEYCLHTRYRLVPGLY
jgi:protein-S-isoprenylcysteine O-methyltransferase Ste14